MHYLFLRIVLWAEVELNRSDHRAVSAFRFFKKLGAMRYVLHPLLTAGACCIMLHAACSSVLCPLCKLLVNFLHFVRTVRHFHANVHQTEIKNEKRKTGLFRDFCKTHHQPKHHQSSILDEITG
jgi:hypothetical protein